MIVLFVKQKDDMQLLYKIELKGNEGKKKNMNIKFNFGLDEVWLKSSMSPIF